MIIIMLPLEEDVAARLQAAARYRGRPFKVIVNERLRAALSQRKAVRTAPKFHVVQGRREGRNLACPMMTSAPCLTNSKVLTATEIHNRLPARAADQPLTNR